MQKVGFYLNNPSLTGGDFTQIMEGNPGVGGSEYEFMLVSYLLEGRDNDIEPWLITNIDGIFPHNNVAQVKNLHECCDYCANHGITQVVIDIKSFEKHVLDEYGAILKFAIWAHNNVSYKLLNIFWELPYISKIINCGREEMELYRDHIATLKSTYVYNIFPFKEQSYYTAKMASSREHNVVYMGSIIEAKGFHVLAKAWKKIVKAVPDAQLYVIGSGKLYDKNAQLGKYNIADKKYEEEFMPYILDGHGEIMSSVHFLGVLREEKDEVMGRCKVGVPNPWGVSETFCICGIEMQLMGCNLTSMRHPAYLDTFYNQSYLYDKTSELAKYVVARLQSPNDNPTELYKFVTSKFGVDGNIERWERVIHHFDDVMVEPISVHKFQYKQLKDKMLHYKITHQWARQLPCIEQSVLLRNRIVEKIYRIFGIPRY